MPVKVKDVPKISSANRSKLPRRVRRRLEREKKRREKNPARAKKLAMKRMRNRQIPQHGNPQEKPTLKATVADAMQAKQKAEESLKILRDKLMELQTNVGRYTGLRRNAALDMITKITNRIKGTENLIAVYEEWLKREKTIEKLGENVKKNAPK